MQNQIEDSDSDICTRTEFLQGERDQWMHGMVGSHATQIHHAGKYQPYYSPQKLPPFTPPQKNLNLQVMNIIKRVSRR